MSVNKADLFDLLIRAIVAQLCDGSDKERLEITDAGLKALFESCGTELACDGVEEDVLMYTQVVDWEGEGMVN